MEVGVGVEVCGRISEGADGTDADILLFRDRGGAAVFSFEGFLSGES